MDSKYKCDHTTPKIYESYPPHQLDVICRDCMKAWIARHDAMLEFVKKVAQTGEQNYSLYTDDEMQIEADKGYLHAINICEARKLLKEIGE